MSTKYKRHHGIEMVPGAKIRNLQLETLATDPTVPNLGQLWIDDSTGMVKYATLDSEGATVVKIVGDDSAVEAIEAAIAILNGDDTVEGSVDYKLQQLHQTILGGATQETLDQISELAAAIGDDPSFSVTVANQIQTARDEIETGVSEDIGNLQTAMGANTTKLANVITSLGVMADGTVPAFEGTSYLSGQADLLGMVIALDVALKARADAIANLENKLGDTTNLTTNEKANIVAALNEVNAKVDTAVDGVKVEMNSKVKVYDSGAETKTSHVFAHGFTNPSVAFDVQVYEAGVWLTDGVACENDVATGTVTVDVGEAARVQIIARDATPMTVLPS